MRTSFARVDQRQESSRLEREQCRFESDLGYQFRGWLTRQAPRPGWKPGGTLECGDRALSHPPWRVNRGGVLKTDGTARCGDRHVGPSPIGKVNRSGLRRPFEAGWHRQRCGNRHLRLPPVWSAQPVRRPARFAKPMAPSGCGFRISAAPPGCCSSTVEPHVGIVQTSDRPRAAAPVHASGKPAAPAS